MTRHNFTPRLRSGVTLIEVLLVVVISVLMATLALGGITNRGRARFDDGMNQVLNNLRKIQNEAVNGQAPICKGGETGCLASGHQVFGRSVSFKTTSNEYETSLLNSWGPDNQGVEQLPAFRQLNKFPAGVKLVKIEQNNPHPDVGPESTPGGAMTMGLLVFTRGSAMSASNTQVRSVGYPHFFNQDIINPGVVGRYLNSDGSGYVAAARAVTYVIPRDNVVTLTFQSPDNASIHAKIVIDGKSGTMEIVQ